VGWGIQFPRRKEMSQRRVVAFVAFIAFIALVVGVTAVGDALAGERGKVVRRNANHMTTFQSVKVGDVEGHNLYLLEAKGITFHQNGGLAWLPSPARRMI
jgi:uncharacterized membrane protein